LVLFIDPTTKALLARFGSLEMVAYYDMASRLVMQFRQLTVSSLQILTALMASMADSAPERIRSLYVHAFVTLAVASFVGYGGMQLCLPLVSEIWIGRVQPDFVLFASILAGASFVNTLSCPAFFANLGTGKVGQNTFSLISQTAANLILGAVAGAYAGGIGVVLGTALATILGSAMLIRSFHREYQIAATDLFPGRTGLLVLFTTIALILGYWFQHEFDAALGTMNVCAFNLGLFALLVLPCAWLHPAREAVLTKLCRGRG
jgi:O-antigen/teichoic acid export membrane protein